MVWSLSSHRFWNDVFCNNTCSLWNKTACLKIQNTCIIMRQFRSVVILLQYLVLCMWHKVMWECWLQLVMTCDYFCTYNKTVMLTRTHLLVYLDHTSRLWGERVLSPGFMHDIWFLTLLPPLWSCKVQTVVSMGIALLPIKLMRSRGMIEPTDRSTKIKFICFNMQYIKLKRHLLFQSNNLKAMSAQIGMITFKVESLNKWMSKNVMNSTEECLTTSFFKCPW